MAELEEKFRLLREEIARTRALLDRLRTASHRQNSAGEFRADDFAAWPRRQHG
jgi:uncharacterized small protein (DUF1192 family)